MKTILLLSMLVPVVPGQTHSQASNTTLSYVIGGLIALFILGYLVYSLLKPEKF